MDNSNFWIDWKPEVTYTIILVVVGGLWTFMTYLISYKAEKSRERINVINIIRSLNNELKVWADEAIDILSEIGHLCEIDPKRNDDFFSKRIKLLTVLSAHIDKGRFFLPNTEKDIYGHHKPFAFQGITREPISQLKLCYKILDKEFSYSDQSVNKPLKGKLMDTKRAFCSSIQKALNPDQYFISFKEELENK